MLPLPQVFVSALDSICNPLPFLHSIFLNRLLSLLLSVHLLLCNISCKQNLSVAFSYNLSARTEPWIHTTEIKVRGLYCSDTKSYKRKITITATLLPQETYNFTLTAERYCTTLPLVHCTSLRSFDSPCKSGII